MADKRVDAETSDSGAASAPSEGTNNQSKTPKSPAAFSQSRKSTMDYAEMYVSGTATPMTLGKRETLDFDDFFVRSFPFIF
jgi:hypothetical protein